MTADRDAGVARIEDALVAEIADQPDGTLLPSETRLMRRFGESRSVVRSAIGALERRFLVRRVQGRGTFVNRRVEYPISSAVEPSFHGIVSASGATARVVTLSHRVEVVDDDRAAALGISPGDRAIRLERLGYIDDAPACFFDEWVTGDITTDLQTALRVVGSLGEVIRGTGGQMRRERLSGSVDVAPPAVCARLEIDPYTHTWFVESHNVDAATGRPLMVSYAWTRIDRVRMVFGR